MLPEKMWYSGSPASQWLCQSKKELFKAHESIDLFGAARDGEHKKKFRNDLYKFILQFEEANYILFTLAVVYITQNIIFCYNKGIVLKTLVTRCITYHHT